MKSIFKLFTISSFITFFLSSPFCYGANKKMILISGKASPQFTKMLKRSLQLTVGKENEFVHYEESNRHCKVRVHALIQLCINNDDLRIIHQNKNVLKRSLGRLISLENN